MPKISQRLRIRLANPFSPTVSIFENYFFVIFSEVSQCRKRCQLAKLLFFKSKSALKTIGVPFDQMKFPEKTCQQKAEKKVFSTILEKTHQIHRIQKYQSGYIKTTCLDGLNSCSVLYYIKYDAKTACFKTNHVFKRFGFKMDLPETWFFSEKMKHEPKNVPKKSRIRHIK